MVALGMVVPVLPQVVLGFVNGDAAQAAHVVGALGAMWATMQFISMPIMGALSDRFGRRPVILLSNFGMALSYALVAIAPNLIWLAFARLISGAAAASVSTANAYIADVTPPEKRAARFGLLGAAFGAGFVLGPALGGLLGAQDPRLPYYAAAIFSFANGLYGVFVLPESLKPENRRAFAWSRANPVGTLKFFLSKPALGGIAAMRFLEGLAQVVLPSTFVLYAAHRYGWDTQQVGLTLATVGVASVVVNVLVVRRVVAAFGERRALLAGLAFGATGFCIYGLAWRGELFWVGIPFAALWAMAGAGVQAIATRKVAPSEQGELQGALAAVMGVSGMVGPLIFTSVFALGVEGKLGADLPGAPFLLASLLVACAWMIGLRVAR
ncbi:MAG: MFS transporter [Alphaproteobacteria bacterium]|nr:MFS transporter [Alphaproteobacteria bacterium]